MAKGKLFRIEQSRVPAGKLAKSGDSPVNGRELEEIRDSLEALRKDVRSLSARESTSPPPPPSGVDAETFRQQIVEAERLKADLQELSEAIERTKQEIATLRSADPTNDKIATASEALRAVVGDTEYATNGIINAAEAIEDVAGRLRAELTGEAQTQVDELFEHATAIFEACNFQDITGQRITKVVNTMEFIDERVRKMMEIWGGDSAFASVSRGEEKGPPTPGEELHGPAIDGDGSIGQDEIDALFD